MMQEDELTLMRYQGRTVGAQVTITLTELAQAVHCHPELVRQLAEKGVVEPQETRGDGTVFSAEAVWRLGRGLRLRRDLGIGVHALPLVLDLLERIDDLEEEVQRLKGVE